MEEKILIKSELDTKAKTTLFAFVWSFVGIGIIAILSLLLIRDDYYRRTALKCILTSSGDIEKYYVILIIGAVFLITGLVLYLCFRGYAKCELTVTGHSVKGKTIGGKVVTLPLQQISAYSTTKWHSTIEVSTSSGTTKFSLIKNYEEIGAVLAKKINSKQDQPIVTPVAAPATAPARSESMDDLVKLKSLLDAGIITQEEFEAKKKQILGL